MYTTRYTGIQLHVSTWKQSQHGIYSTYWFLVSIENVSSVGNFLTFYCLTTTINRLIEYLIRMNFIGLIFQWSAFSSFYWKSAWVDDWRYYDRSITVKFENCRVYRYVTVAASNCFSLYCHLRTAIFSSEEWL